MSRQYDILYIQQYLDGQLSPEQMHDLERAAMEDAMLHDAIEGFRLSENINHKQLSLLQQRLSIRIESQHTEKNTFYFTGQRLAVASVAGVMLIVLGILFWMMNNRQVAERNSNLHTTETILLDKPNVTLISGAIEPRDTWSAFEDYLSVNGSKLASGLTVKVHLEIKNGRPETVHVLSQESEKVAREIGRLLKDGPAWKGESGEITITF